MTTRNTKRRNQLFSVLIGLLIVSTAFVAAFMINEIWLDPLVLNPATAVTVRDRADMGDVTKGIMSLFVEYHDISDSELSSMIMHTHLIELDITGCENITDAGIRGLSRHKGLESLHLSGTDITHNGLAFLRNNVHVRTLQLSKTNVSSLDFLSSKNSNLAELDISHCDIGRGDIERVALLPSLSELNISGCNKLSTQDVVLLSSSSTLKVLTLGGHQLDYQMVKELVENGQIRVLHMDNDDASLRSLLSKIKTDFPELIVKWN